MNFGKKKHAQHKKSFLTAFRGRVFRWLWAATVVSNIGWWMYNAAAG